MNEEIKQDNKNSPKEAKQTNDVEKNYSRLNMPNAELSQEDYEKLDERYLKKNTNIATFRYILASLLCIVSSLLIMPETQISLDRILYELGARKIFGIIVFSVSICYFLFATVKDFKDRKRETSFLDIDRKSNYDGLNYYYSKSFGIHNLTEPEKDSHRIREKQRKLLNQLGIELLNEGLGENKNPLSDKETKSIYKTESKTPLGQFEEYFYSMVKFIEEEVSTCNQKASNLLDRGSTYAFNGLVFFALQIIAWQIYFALTTFANHHIYGMVSFSVMFIFIEFLAAWYLKQYRHFVDTSTHLIKVKTILDRYMLTFLAIQQLGPKDDNSELKLKEVLNTLREEIKWPETYLWKNGDVSFAKEAMETFMQMQKTFRSEMLAKNQKKENDT